MNVPFSMMAPRLVSEFGYSEQGAEQIIQDLQTCPLVIQEAFEDWWKGDGLNEQVEAQGYTLQRLITEYHFEPIGAFLTLAWLIREPVAALQALSRGYDSISFEPGLPDGLSTR